MSTPPAARSEPTGSAASAELDDENIILIDQIGGGAAAAAAPPPAPRAKHAHRPPTSTSGGLTLEGRTRLDHLENELDRLIRTLTTDSSSSSPGSDVDSICDSSSSTGDCDIDNNESSNERNEAAGNKTNLGGSTPRPEFDLFSAGDDMMDAVEDLLDSTAPLTRSKIVSTNTTTTTNDAAKFTLSGKKITYLTVTELHKEKRRLKRRLRELKNEADERKGAETQGNHDCGIAEIHYDMYRAITERITILEWKELMEQSGGDGGSISEGSFAAACATGITQRGKQQSDLVRIVEEGDECEAGEDFGTNANAFNDSDSDTGDADSSKANLISESDCSTADSDSDTSSDLHGDDDDDDDDDIDGLFNFSDDLEHGNGNGKSSADDNQWFDQHFSSELFSPFTSSTSPIKTAKPENTMEVSSSVTGSDSPLRPRKLFDGSIGAARTAADASEDTGSSDGGTLASDRIVESHALLPEEDRPPDAAILLFSPPFEVRTRKDPDRQKRPSSDADETGSTLITEDDTITQASGLLDIYPCLNVEDQDPNSPNVLIKENWETQSGNFYATPSQPASGEGRQGLLAGAPGTVQLPASCKPRAGAGKFSIKSLASIARGAKKQVNNAVIDAEKMKYLRGKTTTPYSKVVEETDRELMREIVNATKSEDEKTSASVAPNEYATVR